MDYEDLKEVDPAGNLSWVTDKVELVAAGAAPVDLSRNPSGLSNSSAKILLN